MSQEGVLSFDSAATFVETITGNSGGPIGPNASGNIDLMGDNSVGINIAGNPVSHTLVVSGIPATTTQIGVVELASNAQAIAGIDSLNAVTSSALAAKLGTQTAHSVALFEGSSSALSSSNIGNNGQVLIGATGADPAFATVTSSGSTLTYTTGINTLNIDVTAPLNVAHGGTGLTSITAHDLVVGNGTGALNLIAPSATSGVPLISQGAAADPTFGTALVAGGGTGITTTTAFGVICGGTTATGNFQNSGTGSAGQLLQSGGNAALPAYTTATFPATATGTGTILRADGTNWVATTATYPTTTTSQQILYSTAANVIGQLTTANSAIAATNSSGTLAMRALSVVTQVFTTPGANTYTPTAGMLYCVIECVGGGGGGGGTATAAASTQVSGAGGGGGAYSRISASAATIGGSQTATVGAAGTAGTAGNNAGGNGGASSVGVICTANGGTGGAGNNGNQALTGGAGGTAGTGAFSIPGQFGDDTTNTGVILSQGKGGSSVFGFGGRGQYVTTATTGIAASNYGGGGGGGMSYNATGTAAGGAGTAGIVIITEYVIA